MEKKAEIQDLLRKHKVDKHFSLGIDSAAAFLPKMVHLVGQKDTYTNENPVWQSPRAMIVRKDLRKDIKSYFDFAILLLREFDFLNKAFRDCPYNDFTNTGKHLPSLRLP